MIAYDLFCGAGGASCGLRDAGYDVIGFEKWDVAADTHDKNHETPVQRVDLERHDWRGWSTPDLLWASPPCQPFSAAGSHAGENDERDGMPAYLAAVEALRPPVTIMENVKGLTFTKHRRYRNRMLTELLRLGYDYEWRVLDAADYGVPQNRERFFLIARRDGGRIRWPIRTHRDRWVTMADALGWTEGRVGASAVVLAQLRRDVNEPAQAVTEKARSWVLRTGANTMKHGRTADEPYERAVDRPAPTVDVKAGVAWAFTRPATTIAGDPRCMAPGRHDPELSGSQMAGAIRLTVEEAARLQAFPDGYVWCGTKTAIFQQIGNAVPPPLAHAVAAANTPVVERAA